MITISTQQTEDFSPEERAFLNTLLNRDFRKRPTFEQLKHAIDGDRQLLSVFPGLKWLSQVRRYIHSIHHLKTRFVFGASCLF